MHRRDLVAATLEQKLAYSMLLLEAEQWPPLQDALPSKEKVAEKLEMLRGNSDNWVEAYKQDLRAKLSRSDVRVLSVRRYLLEHGIDVCAPDAQT